jgi:hypothetical protein
MLSIFITHLWNAHAAKLVPAGPVQRTMVAQTVADVNHDAMNADQRT